MGSPKEAKRVRLERCSPFYWRVTFDQPPLNIFGPDGIPLIELVSLSKPAFSGRSGRCRHIDFTPRRRMSGG
jgi:hypothetical protein